MSSGALRDAMSVLSITLWPGAGQEGLHRLGYKEVIGVLATFARIGSGS